MVMHRAVLARASAAPAAKTTETAASTDAKKKFASGALNYDSFKLRLNLYR